MVFCAGTGGLCPLIPQISPSSVRIWSLCRAGGPTSSQAPGHRLSSRSQNQLLSPPPHTRGHFPAPEPRVGGGSAVSAGPRRPRTTRRVQLAGSVSTTQAQGPAPRAPKHVPRCRGRGEQPGPAAPPGTLPCTSACYGLGGSCRETSCMCSRSFANVSPRLGPPGSPARQAGGRQRSRLGPQTWSATRPGPHLGRGPSASLGSWQRLTEAQRVYGKAAP